MGSMRPQDYDAMAEQCRRLEAENAALKAKREKKEKPPRDPYAPRPSRAELRGAALVIAVLVGLVVIGVAITWSNSRPYACYQVVAPPQNAEYEGWFVRGVRRGLGSSRLVRGPLTEAEARGFISKWHLKECK